MSVARATRSSQAIMTKGLGQHFTSPRKPRDKKKRCMAIPVPGNGSKWQKLLDELKDLLTPQPSDTKPSPSTIDRAASPIHELEEPPEAPPMELDDASFTIDAEDESCSVPTERVRTVCPTARSISMCASWKALIPTLIDPFLKYTASTLGQPLSALGSLLSSCSSGCQERKSTEIFCLFFDCKECNLQPFPHSLTQHLRHRVYKCPQLSMFHPPLHARCPWFISHCAITATDGRLHRASFFVSCTFRAFM